MRRGLLASILLSALCSPWPSAASADGADCITAVDRAVHEARGQPRDRPDADDSEQLPTETSAGTSAWTLCGCLTGPDAPADGPARLERLLEAPPPIDGCAAFYLAQHRERSGLRAHELYEQAALAFTAGEIYDGVFWARLNRGRLASQEERWTRAAAELDVAQEAAELHDEPMLARHAGLERLRLRIRMGEDFPRIADELRQLLDDLPDDPRTAPLERRILTTLGAVAFRLGRHREARTAWTRLEALQLEAGDLYGQANTKLNLALEHVTIEAADLAAAGRAMRQARDTARAGGHRTVEAVASGQLALLVDEPERSALFVRALALADAASLPVQRRDLLAARATTRAARDPDSARTALDEALGLVQSDGFVDDLVASSAYLWEARMRVAWATLPPDEAFAASLAVLDDLEVLRARQLARGGRGDYFARWNVANDWLAGLLFEQAAGRPIDLASLDAVEPPPHLEPLTVGDPEALARAVLVLERRRARLLQDTAELADAPSEGAGGDASRALDALGDRMASLHRRLLSERLSSDERRAIEASLDALEAEEDAVWRRLEDARNDAVAEARAPAPPAVELDALRRALKPDEALVIAQSARGRDVYGHFAGGSWLAVATRDELFLHRLPDPRRLELAVDTFAGLLEAHQNDVVLAADAIWRLALEPAIEALPPGVEHLIVLADGPLHRLPLAAVGPSPDALLGLRYAISRPPSAVLWLDWRERPARSDATAAALVFADPALAENDGEEEDGTPRIATTRSFDGVELGRLPGAAAEARTVRRRLGQGTEVLIGDAAREASLDALDLDRFGAIHFAAHALVDPRRERRSGVVLAPSGRDDGLLRPPEIARLPLDDQLVVLSACHGAAGRVLRGEGPLSLARSFFEAGARSVVAGLWRLRDDEAERFADAFYASLAGGASVADAARDARRALFDAGASPAAWAALVVLGDGALVPFPVDDAAVASTSGPTIPIVAGIVAAVGLALGLVLVVRAVVRTRRRRRSL